MINVGKSTLRELGRGEFLIPKVIKREEEAGPPCTGEEKDFRVFGKR